MVNPDWTHLLASFIWGLYGLVIGAMAVSYRVFDIWVALSVITAIVGNSAHLVAFAWSKKAATITSTAGKT